MTGLAIPRLSCVLIRSLDIQACVNLNDAEIVQDKSLKKRFVIVCNRERRKFHFESVLDVDHADWFSAIKKNIKVTAYRTSDPVEFDEWREVQEHRRGRLHRTWHSDHSRSEESSSLLSPSSLASRTEETPSSGGPEAAGEAASHASPEREGRRQQDAGTSLDLLSSSPSPSGQARGTWESATLPSTWRSGFPTVSTSSRWAWKSA